MQSFLMDRNEERGEKKKRKEERKKGKSGRAGDTEGRRDRESVEGGIMNAGIIAVVT